MWTIGRSSGTRQPEAHREGSPGLLLVSACSLPGSSTALVAMRSTHMSLGGAADENEEARYGKQLGPEPHQFDPYDGMTDRKFESEVLAALDAAKQRQKAISIKLPETLLERTREEAKRRGVPYQTLIKILLERSLDRLGAA